MFKHLKTPRILHSSIPMAIGLFGVVAIAGCASAGPYNPANLQPAQLGQVQQICRSVMGIPVGIGLSADCVANLSASAAALRKGDAQVRSLETARRACLGKGLAAGDPSLSVCELSTASDHGAPAADLANVRIDTTGLTAPAGSYFNASFAVVRRREQMACARLGFDPINGSFANCVASLDSALFASEHAAQ
jgi:hypothetical protein